MSPGNWAAALSFSLLAHLGLAAAYLYSSPQDMGDAADYGEGGLTVGLGMAGSYIDTVKTASTEETTEDSLENPTEKLEDKPEEIIPPVPEKTPPEPTTPTVADIKQEELVTAPTATRNLVNKAVEKPAPVTRPTMAEKPREKSETQSRVATANTPAQKTVVSQKATGRGNTTMTGGKKGDARRYFGDIMSWLNQHKHYPPELKKKKTQGVVTVQFSIDRNGVLLSSTILKSSGHPKLDESALKMLQDASPLPPIPDWMDRETLKLSIPVEYSLITNKSH